MIVGRMARATPWCALALTATLVAGCEQPRPASPTRLYAIDQTGAAKSCNVSRPSLTDGAQADATMTLNNDGGWCGISISRGGRPYSAGLVTARPAKGKVYIHTVGDETRIDYTPEAKFTGTDSFTTKLVPGEASLRITVTVTAR